MGLLGRFPPIGSHEPGVVARSGEHGTKASRAVDGAGRANADLRCSAGCACRQPNAEVCDNGLPHELLKTVLPPYTIEPPDILLIDALRVIPLPPYRVEPLDGLVIQVNNAFPMAPISGLYVVDPDGTVNFGPPYKARMVSVVGKTLPEAKAAIEDALKQDIVKPEVDVSLGQSHAPAANPG